MRNLELRNKYTRKEIHSIFSPATKFTPGAGYWGIQGMIKVPAREGDWVFIVTIGQHQGDHFFDESITEDGVLSWQSQPRLNLSSDTIKSLINHDDRINNIHLFFREKKDEPYRYLGRLGYLTHDSERENPVYFQWQILDWESEESFIETIGFELVPNKKFIAEKPFESKKNQLIFENKPEKTRNSGTTTHEFRSRKAPDYGLKDSKNRMLGLEGELLVLNQEKDNLRKTNRDDLADKVLHTSVVEGDGAGYDIKSFDDEGNIKYIEVKTTKGSANTSFFISPNELEFSKQNKNHYFLYRLYEYQIDTSSSKAYILEGDLSDQINITPTQFKAHIK